MGENFSTLKLTYVFTLNADVSQFSLIAQAQVQTLSPKEMYMPLVEKWAAFYHVSVDKMVNIIDGETGGTWDNTLVGGLGELGIVQILPSAWPHITKEQALTPDFSIQFLAQQISLGHDYYWSECSCIKYARALGVRIPTVQSASDLQPNGIASIGNLVLLHYSTEDHVAVIEGFTKDGTGLIVRESNFSPCKVGTRIIALSDPHIAGFWDSEVYALQGSNGT